MKDKSIWRKLYNLSTNYWWFTSIIMTLAGTLVIIANINGLKWGLKDEKNNFTSLFLWIFWFVFSFSTIIVLAKNWADKYNQNVINNGQKVLSKLIDCFHDTKNSKYNRFLNFINENEKHCDPFPIITQPKPQIEKLLDNIQVNFSDLFGIDRSKIGLSIIYKFNDAEKWKWFTTNNVFHDVDLKELVSNNSSAIYPIIQGEQLNVFWADKRDAIKEKNYLPGKIDKDNANIGSIICRDISIKYDNVKYLNAILNITTYGKLICGKNDLNAKDKIENIILYHFDYRLKLELSLFYIKEKIYKQI